MLISDWNKKEIGSNGTYVILFDISDSAYILCDMSITDLMAMKEKIEQILKEDNL
jgi:hypothetical protein